MTSNATPPDAELGLESNVTLEAAPSEDSRVEEKATVLKVEKVENVTLEKKVDNKFITTALRPIFKFRAPTKTKPKRRRRYRYGSSGLCGLTRTGRGHCYIFILLKH